MKTYRGEKDFAAGSQAFLRKAKAQPLMRLCHLLPSVDSFPEQKLYAWPQLKKDPRQHRVNVWVVPEIREHQSRRLYRPEPPLPSHGPTSPCSASLSPQLPLVHGQKTASHWGREHASSSSRKRTRYHSRDTPRTFPYARRPHSGAVLACWSGGS